MSYYKLTGEYRCPKEGEWYLESLDAPPKMSNRDRSNWGSFHVWILERQKEEAIVQ